MIKGLHSSVAVAALLAAMPANAQSQAGQAPANPVPAEAPTQDEVQDIIVTGFRASLASAIETKRSASAVVDSISAEDIGKFPEQNLAESLQRITGVQITRSRGEGSNVSIRGLSPEFNQINYNGRSLPSAGGRSFDFTILSAELINGIDVYKSPVPELQEGGLAGTVNVRSLSPFDVTKTRFVVNAEGLYEQNSGKVGPHVSGLFATRALDNRLSVVLGVDYSRRKYRIDRYEAFGLEKGVESQRTPPQDYNLDGDFNDTLLFNHASNFAADTGTRDRRTLLGSIGYEVSDTFRVWAETLQSRFADDVLNQTFQYTRFTNISTANAVRASKVGADNILTFLDVDGVDNRAQGSFTQTVNRLQSYAGGFDINSGPFKLSAQSSYGKSRSVLNSQTLSIIARGSVSEDLSVDPNGPAQLSNNRGFNPQTADWRVLGYTGAYNSPTTDTVWENKLDGTFKVDGSLLKAIKGGLYYTDRRRSFTNVSLTINADKLAPLLGETYTNVEGGSFAAGTKYVKPNSISNFLDGYSGPVTVPTSWVDINLDPLLSRYSVDDLAQRFGTTVDLPSTYKVKEASKAAYLRADFGTEENRISGNVGVRIVQTDMTSSGYAPDLSLITFNQQGATTIVPGVTPVTYHNSYTRVLPSLNIKGDLTDTLVLRGALARLMSRPSLSVLSPSTTVNANVRTITRGNPMVKPYMSNQADLTLEWYPASGALLSASLFYKHVTDFILSTSSPLTLNVSQVQGGGTIALPFTVSQPNNGGSSNVRGFEVGYQQPLTFLPAPFDRLGVIANYTYVVADGLPVVQGGPKLPLPGVSKNNYNLVAYYEHAGLSVRASYNFRDRFVVDSNSYFGDGQYTNAFRQLDLSASYAITKNFDIHLDVVNATNALLTNSDVYGVNRGIEDTGRRVIAGVRFTM